MSIHVIGWVLKHSESRLGDRLVALVLADHAKEDGTWAWPSVETIADQAHLSERQARRCLRNLEELGEILETGTSSKGTHIYSFPKYIAQGGHIVRPRKQTGGTNRAELVSDLSPDPSLEPSEDQLLAERPKDGRAKNPVWDALSEIFGEPVTRPAQRERGQVCRDLTEAGATADEVFARAKRWALHFDSATLTDHALVKHWHTLPLKPRRMQR